MRNCEVYAYIERLYDALHSGSSDSDVIDETLGVVMEFEDEVNKEMLAEAKLKSGIESTSFFTGLAESTYDELINIGEHMDAIHPKLGLFMNYLMEEYDPTFFVVFGNKNTKLVGNCDYSYIYNTSKHLCNMFMSRGNSDDK